MYIVVMLYILNMVCYLKNYFLTIYETIIDIQDNVSINT